MTPNPQQLIIFSTAISILSVFTCLTHMVGVLRGVFEVQSVAYKRQSSMFLI